MSIKLGRDPFARNETKRETVYTLGSCDWCGQRGRKDIWLFHYFVEDDNYRRSDIKGNFCNIECCRAYHHT